jgi:plasmid stabilization system protein ParE
VPQIIVTEGAVKGLERCRTFLAAKAPDAAKRASLAIARQFLVLEANPDIGRPVPELPELRELLIDFGDSGYVALYRHDPIADTVYVLAFRHQKEAGFRGSRLANATEILSAPMLPKPGP